ncbi:MAG TPA: efflux transporter periplasmic adaptor subunit, partial [Sphingorhabdus lacus]|nr:efflux transporter periplasmic adaptor subunit [Sphingorhabdus lacus]
VTIESNSRTSPAVPELSLVREGSASFVYTIDSDGKAKRVPVTTGARQGQMVEVLSGLQAGDSIVTEGVVKLSDGVKVRLKKADGAAAQSKSGRK